MSAATLAPMATAPAVPPRTALAADLLRISRKLGCVDSLPGAGAADEAEDDMMDR